MIWRDLADAKRDVTRLAAEIAELRPESHAAATIGDKDAAINKAKYESMPVWDSTNKRILYATGHATTDPWVTALGATAITPA